MPDHAHTFDEMDFCRLCGMAAQQVFNSALLPTARVSALRDRRAREVPDA